MDLPKNGTHAMALLLGRIVEMLGEIRDEYGEAAIGEGDKQFISTCLRTIGEEVGDDDLVEQATELWPGSVP